MSTTMPQTAPSVTLPQTSPETSNPMPTFTNQPDHPTSANVTLRPTFTTYLQEFNRATQDVYTIHLANPARHSCPDNFQKNATLTFLFQRYRCDPTSGTFSAVFPEDITLILKIQRLRPKRGRSGAFPYLLDAHPEITLYTNLCQLRHDDPILHMLNPNLRMTFRYKPEEGLGFLVHIGYDWPHVDEASFPARWRTAFNIRRSTSP